MNAGTREAKSVGDLPLHEKRMEILLNNIDIFVQQGMIACLYRTA
jgi:hypothetical protein